MSITLPDPDPAAPPSRTPEEDTPSPLKQTCCYFGVYPHGMSNEGKVTKILSSEHLDRMLAETEPVAVAAA